RSLCTLLRPLPMSTPFPYTTLFRSEGGESGHQGADRERRRGKVPPEGLEDAIRPEEVRRLRSLHAAGRLSGVRPRRRQPDASAVDRKSTRLNSSHVSISYAVFCLKK